MNRERDTRIRTENNSNSHSGGDLLEEIRALSFVKTELELFLNTHPNSHTALDYYHQTVDALKRLMEQYHNTHGPLRAEGVTDTDRWTWVDTPWPWQAGNGAPEEGGGN